MSSFDFRFDLGGLDAAGLAVAPAVGTDAGGKQAMRSSSKLYSSRA